MPLLNIPYQQLGWNTVRPTDCFGCDEREYCAPVINGDHIYGQFTQTPCGQSIACDGDLDDFNDTEVITDVEFDNLSATEELVNGTFTGSAANWDLQAAWAYGGNMVTKAAPSAGVSYIRQNITPTIPNAIYKIQFTVSGYGGGNIYPYFLTGTKAIVGATTTGDGLKTYYIKSRNSLGGDFSGAAYVFLYIEGDAAFVGSVDGVTMRQIAYDWDFGNDVGGGAWQLNSAGHPETVNALAACVSTGLAMVGVVQPFTTYDLEVVILGGAGGFLAFNVGGNITSSTIVTGATTITLTGISSGAGTDFSTYHPLGFCGTIDTISLLSKESDCWEFDVSHWTPGSGAICHIPGTADLLTNTPTVAANEYYQLKFTIGNRTQGSVNSILNGTPGQAVGITTNDNFVHYFSPTVAGQLQFQTSPGFDGCISAVELFVLRKDFLFELRDKDGNLVADISEFVEYFEDYVTLAVKFSTVEDPETISAPFDCYQIHAYDFCNVEFEEIIGDGDMNTVVGNYDGAQWYNPTFPSTGFPNNGIQNINGQMVFHCDSAGQYRVRNCSLGRPNCPGTHPSIPSGLNNYQIEFDIIQNTDITKNFIQLRYGNNQTNPLINTVGHHIFVVAFDPDVNPEVNEPLVSLQANFNAPIAAGREIIIDNVTMRRIEPFTATFISKCFKYGESFECTKYIEAYCDTPQMGFNFIDTGFRLAHRVYIRAINPSYPEETADYLFSEGTKSRNFGQSEKSYIVVTGLIPEWSHDTIAKQRISEHFLIDSVEWFPLAGDYIPEYTDKNGDVMLASGRFEVQLKDGDTKFFRND